MAVKPTAVKSKVASKPPVKTKATSKAASKAPARATGKTAIKVLTKPAAPTTVTLKHLGSELAERLTLPKNQATLIVTDVFDRVVAYLKAGDRVRIVGLGILEVKSRPARMGRNPATGAAIKIKASKKVAFRAAKDLKEAI